MSAWTTRTRKMDRTLSYYNETEGFCYKEWVEKSLQLKYS